MTGGGGDSDLDRQSAYDIGKMTIMLALKVNIIIVHPSGVVPKGEQL
jgi:hypothetical protein